MSRRLAVGLAGLLVATAGCRSVPSAVPLGPEDRRPALFLRHLEALGQERHALRGVARVALDGPAGSSRSRQVVVAERPARLRVEVHGFLNQLVAVLVSDGRRFALYRPGEPGPEQGPVHASLLEEVTGLPLRPEEAVAVLLGVPSLGAARPGRAEALSDGTLRLELAGEQTRRVTFDEAWNLRRLEVREGGRVLDVRYDDYRSVAGVPFAHAITLEFSDPDARAEVSFQEVELNPELPPGTFALRLARLHPGGAR